MKTITISRRARGVHALLRRARRENIILRSPEGDEFILAEVDDFNREIELARPQCEVPFDPSLRLPTRGPEDP